jgi:hypothetical protein
MLGMAQGAALTMTPCHGVLPLSSDVDASHRADAPLPALTRIANGCKSVAFDRVVVKQLHGADCV